MISEKKSTFLLFLLSLFHVFPLFCQTQFVKTLGGDLGCYSFIQTSAGELVLTGLTESVEGDLDLLIVKCDSSGDHKWARTLGLGPADYGTSIIQTFDGGFAITGGTDSLWLQDVLLTKFDSSGNHLWTRVLEQAGDNLGMSVVETSDHGIAVIGRNLLLAKFDSLGNHEWAKRYDHIDDICVYAASRISGGIAVTGWIWQDDGDALLLRLDDSGNYVWARRFTVGGLPTFGYSVTGTSDGGIVLTGETGAFGTDSNLLLSKFDSAGTHLWTRAVGGSYDEQGWAVTETRDGGILAAGNTRSFGVDSSGVIITKFDSSGLHLWTRILSGDLREYAYSVTETMDGGFIAAGGTRSYGVGPFDILLAKFDSSGQTCIGDFVSPSVETVTPRVYSVPFGLEYVAPTVAEPVPMIAHPSISLTTVCESTDVGEEESLGRTLLISQNRPNPFSTATTIVYEIPAQTHVTVIIYDALGGEVKQVVAAEQPAGRYPVSWNATDDSGRSVSSGAYFLRLEAGQHRATRKLVVVR